MGTTIPGATTTTIPGATTTTTSAAKAGVWELQSINGICGDNITDNTKRKPLGQPVSDWNSDGVLDATDCQLAATADPECQGCAISFAASNNNQCYCDRSMCNVLQEHIAYERWKCAANNATAVAMVV